MTHFRALAINNWGDINIIYISVVMIFENMILIVEVHNMNVENLNIIIGLQLKFFLVVTSINRLTMLAI